MTELSLSEFLCYGPQRDIGKGGKSLLRKTKDGEILSWNVEKDDSFCTLEEAFQKVDSSLGFNVELKFDDHIVYQQEHLIHALQSILKVIEESIQWTPFLFQRFLVCFLICVSEILKNQVVFEHAKDRPIIFSTFQPDAALITRKMQSTYPVSILPMIEISL